MMHSSNQKEYYRKKNYIASHAQNTTALQSNLFLTGLHRLLVTKGWSYLSGANNCQDQLQTAQSISLQVSHSQLQQQNSHKYTLVSHPPLNNITFTPYKTSPLYHHSAAQRGAMEWRKTMMAILPYMEGRGVSIIEVLLRDHFPFLLILNTKHIKLNMPLWLYVIPSCIFKHTHIQRRGEIFFFYKTIWHISI
jgi:hypothetical protein